MSAVRLATIAYLAAASALVALPACETKTTETTAAAPSGPVTPESTVPVKPEKEPEHVQVQHILVAFDRAERTKSTRKRDDAEALAKRLLERARNGEDFNALVKEFTDDAYPGIYGIANDGVRADTSHGEFPRSKMAAAFGSIGFAISPGNVDMAPYQMQDSPFGWHIIKRLK